MKKEKILITGVAGFIGSNIAKRFSERKNIELFGVDDLSTGKLNNIPKNLNFIKIDLSNLSKYEKLPKKIDKILHLAGQSSGEISFDDPVSDLKKNVLSTINLLNYYQKRNLKKFIYASSMSVYGDNVSTKIKENFRCEPLSCYGTGKLMAENYIRILCKKAKYVIFRMFNVYGPGQDLTNLRQGMVSIFIAQAIKKKKIIVKGNKNRIRDFIFIDDVVKFWEKATFNKIDRNLLFNLGTGKGNSVEDLLKTIKLYIPSSKIIFSKKVTPGDQFKICADITRLKDFFGSHKFISMSKGIKYFVNSKL